MAGGKTRKGDMEQDVIGQREREWGLHPSTSCNWVLERGVDGISVWGRNTIIAFWSSGGGGWGRGWGGGGREMEKAVDSRWGFLK